VLEAADLAEALRRVDVEPVGSADGLLERVLSCWPPLLPSATGRKASSRLSSASSRLHTQSSTQRKVSGGGEAQQELVKRLSEFVSALPVGKLEKTTCKDAKDAVMHFFVDWVGVWKAHKPFFRCVLVFAWGMAVRFVLCFYTCGAGGSSSGC